MKEYLEKIASMKEMQNTSDYIEWLVRFLKEHESLYDDEYTYPEEPYEPLEEDDLKNVKLLSTFFGVIDNYCACNLINKSKEEDDHECSYYIKYKDYYFCIGVFAGQGAFCFAELLKEEPKRYVLFENVFNGIEDKDYAEKKEKLEALHNLACELKALGVSAVSIKKAVDAPFFA